MNVVIHIERVVVEGFDLAPAQRQRVQEALQGELQALLVSGGLRREFTSGIAMPLVPAEAIRYTSPVEAAFLGRQIARSVYSGIGGGASTKFPGGSKQGGA